MPTRLLLEGPDIETLLTRVRDEHGPDARIVQADKVRTGGVGGFFTRERYEVAVEVDAPDLAVTTSADPLLDLIGAAERAEDGARTPAATTEVSTEGPAFAEVLQRLQTDVQAAPPQPFRALPGAATPVPAARTALASADVAAAGDEPASPAERLLAATEAFHARMAQARAAEPAAAPAPAPEPVRRQPVPALGEPQPEVAPAPVAACPETPRPAPQPEPPTPAAPTPAAPPAGSGVDLLADLGVPAELLAAVPAAAAADPYAALAAVLAALPAAPRPPAEAGAVLAVVGVAGSALAAARAVAHKLRLDPDAVLLAAPSAQGTGVPADRLVPSALQAARRGRELHGADVPAVVAVDAPLGAAGAAWARDVLAALRPERVWLTADATRKTADVSRHARRLGTVDALVVDGADDTEDPAALLGIGLPVAMLDGRRATRSAWSALVVARMAGEDDE